jgi:hypothetical protein
MALDYSEEAAQVGDSKAPRQRLSRFFFAPRHLPRRLQELIYDLGRRQKKLSGHH